MDLKTEDIVKNTYRLRFLILIFLGVFLVVFSLLRYFQWDHKDLKLLSGIGVVFLLVGIDMTIKEQYSFYGIIGAIISLISVFTYYVFESQLSDIVAFTYAIGITVISTDIIVNDYFGWLKSDLEEFLETVKREIKSINPQQDRENDFIGDFSDLALDVWRMEKKLKNIGQNIPENQVMLLENSLHRLKRVFSKHEIEIIDYTNQKFNEGMNIDIISIEKDESAPYSYIKETIEPTILFQGKILRKGKIIIIKNN